MSPWIFSRTHAVTRKQNFVENVAKTFGDGLKRVGFVPSDFSSSTLEYDDLKRNNNYLTNI